MFGEATVLRVTAKEIRQALPPVIIIVVLSIVCGLIVLTIGMPLIGFDQIRLHYTLAIIFPLIITPILVFPLVIMGQRLKKLKVELEGLLRLDGLIGIPNRRAFFERARAAFSGDSPVAAMMIDVDHFKKVNDTYGHAVGDAVLRAVGQVIKRVVEAAPRGGPRIAARLGGEEFGALIENIGPKDAGQLAQEIVEQVRAAPVVAGEHTIPVTVSVGLALRRDEETPDALMQAADAACYEAKRTGRNRWRHAAELVERLRSEDEAVGVVCQLAAAG